MGRRCNKTQGLFLHHETDIYYEGVPQGISLIFILAVYSDLKQMLQVFFSK